jgi:phosphoribosylaminoimidazole-succinocarboxamide synthase
MSIKSEVEKQLAYTLDNFEIPALGSCYHGKVRDSYVVGDKRILVTSDRLSAFDVILSTIPFKGQVLNEMAAYWFDQTKDIIQNHIIARPHPNVFVCQQVEILPVEVIVRGYLTGSAWRDYQAGKDISGIKLPAGRKRWCKFETPLITPSTKAKIGKHDMPISSEEIVSSGLVDAKIWAEVCEKALALFERGSQKSLERGLILVDTKYELGILKTSSGAKLVLADEVHTPDSSRYWIADDYQERFANGVEPQMLDKEFIRGWLIERGYMGEGTPPKFEDEFRVNVALKYIDVCEKITGKKFNPEARDIKSEIIEAVKEFSS